MERQTTLSAIIDEVIARILRGYVRVVPGIVTAYHAGSATAAATVDVQCAVNDVRFDVDTGARVSEPWDVIPAVPLATLRFGPFLVAGPAAVGGKVVLLAFDLDPSAHQKSGGREDPVDVRRHAGTYFLALPVDITDASAAQSGAAAGSALVIGADGAAAQIVVSGSTIQLGASGGDFVALASKVDAGFAAIVSALNAHTHTVTAVGSPTGPSTPPATPPASTASALVAAQ